MNPVHAENTPGWEAEDRRARELVTGLNQPVRAIYWADLTATAVVTWCAFAVAAAAAPFSRLELAAAIVAAAAFYRGVCFIHELTHLRPNAVPGFETAWNLLFGVPALTPSFTYIGVHQDHHRVGIYGTKGDPEYLPFAGSPRRVITLLLQSVIFPLLLLARFLVLAPAALVCPPLHRWLLVHASSLAVNPEYRRELSAALERKAAFWEVVAAIYWYCAITVLSRGVLLRFICLWSSAVAVASFVNALRTLASHRFENAGQPMSRQAQVIDSIDIPGAVWTALWAPVGLRYHALHHYFPGIPYHNLGLAYRRLTAELPGEAQYRTCSNRNLAVSLATLVRGRSRLRFRNSAAN
jgi:fatty acid desaturase